MSVTITQFPIEGRNPEDTVITRDSISASDKFVIQNGTIPKVISKAEAVKLFAPVINNTPLNYVPTATDNTVNLNEYVIGSNGKKYFIDAYGNATERGLESKGRYDSIESAIADGLQNGERFTLDNPNSSLHSVILEVII